MTAGAGVATLQVLGPVVVRGPEGWSSVPLTQPRQLAVLAYLVLARPRGLHGRDTVIGLLWPEATQAQGRHALRNALHGLRRALGPGIVITAGDNLVGIDVGRIDCDALALEQDREEGRLEAALARYQGPLLEGFHVTDAPEFEHWVATERARLQGIVISSASDLIESCHGRGDSRGELQAARRALELDLYDEAALRRLMLLLAESGQRPAALQQYEAFAARLSSEFASVPSTATREVEQTIRRSFPPDPGGVQDAAPAVAAAPASGLGSVPRARPRGRLWVVGVAGLVLVLVGGTLFRSSGRGDLTSTGLPVRYASDTVLLRRYLQADALRRGDQSDSALSSFKQLTEDAPLYAPGWAGYSLALNESGYGLPSHRALERSRAAAERALALDSALPGPYTAMASYHLSARWDYRLARQWIDAGLRRNPDNPELEAMLSDWYLFQGRVKDGLVWIRRARMRDPLQVWYARDEGRLLYYLHRCDEARRLYQATALEYRQDPGADLLFAYRALNCLGQRDEAAIVLRETLISWGDTSLAKVLDPPLGPEQREAALETVWRTRLARMLLARQRSFMSAMGPAIQYAELRIADSSLMWLDSAFAERSFGLRSALVDPLFDFVRDDSQFQQLTARVRSALPDR